MDKSQIHTVYGTFIGNKIYTDNNEIINCITYAINRKHIDNANGFYNLKWSDDVNNWILFQYVLTD